LKEILPAFILFLASLVLIPRAPAEIPAAWTTPEPPFRIAGDAAHGLYYVGSQDLASYLIVTPGGDILINSNLESSPPQIKKSIASLGFHMSDIKILLVSHGHYDHCAGSAEILRETHAKFEVMAQDVPVIESGGHNDFNYANNKSMWFPPAHVDRALHDGSTVSLGGVTLTAHLTAGHTKGTTTWTFDLRDGGRVLHAVIVGSPNVNPGYKLVHNAHYPQIASDYRHEFEVLQMLPCDLFLGAHGGYFGLDGKYPRFKAGDRGAFIDPAGYQAYIADRKRAFEDELKKQSGK
jgi:metallo-beta-lactamase class B